MNGTNPRIAGFHYNTLFAVGTVLFADAYWREMQELGNLPPIGAELTQCIPDIEPIDRFVIIGTVAELIGMITQAWGATPFLVFYHAKIEGDANIERALTSLCMSAIGHGINIEDDFSEHMDRARKVLGMELKASPVDTELSELDDLAMTYANAE